MDYSIIESRMDKVVSHLIEGFSLIRAGRANPAILNKVEIEYYGMATPLNQIATVSVPEARQILVSPWDKGMLGLIEKAIQKADIGVNPINDGSVIRINFPELNEQRRKEITKEIKSIGEDSKVAIRNVRRDSIDEAKKAQKENEMTEDELKTAEEKIQKLTDKYIEEIEKNVAKKEMEIMEI